MSLRTIIHLDNEQLNLKTNKQLLAYIKRLHKRDITLTDCIAQEKSIQKLPKGIQDQLNDITKGLPYGWREQISSLCMRLRTVTDKLGIYVHSTTGEIAEAIGKLNTHTSKIPPRGTVGKLERLLDGIYTAMGFATEDDYSRVKPNSSSLIKEIGRLRDSLNQFPDDLQRQLSSMVPDGSTSGWHVQLQDLMNRHLCTLKALHLDKESNGSHIVEAIGRLENAKNIPHGGYGQFVIDAAIAAGLREKGQYKYADIIEAIEVLKDDKDRYKNNAMVANKEKNKAIDDLKNKTRRCEASTSVQDALGIKNIPFDKSPETYYVEAIEKLKVKAKTDPYLHLTDDDYKLLFKLVGDPNELVYTKPGAVRAIMRKLENSSNIEMYRTRLSNIAGMLDIPSKLLDNINTEDFAKAIDKFKEVTQAELAPATLERIRRMVPGKQTLDWNIQCLLSRLLETCNTLGLPITSTSGEIVDAIREPKKPKDFFPAEQNLNMANHRQKTIEAHLGLTGDDVGFGDIIDAIENLKEMTQADIPLTTVARIGNMVPGSQTLNWNIKCMLSRIVEACNTLEIDPTSTTGKIVDAIRTIKSDLGNCKTSIASSEESDNQIATCLGIDYATSGTSDYIDAIENLQKGSNTFDISKETLSNVDKLFPDPDIVDLDDRVNRMFLRIEATCANLEVGADSGVLDIQRAIRDMKKESKSKPINLNTVVLHEDILEQLKRMSKKTHKGSALKVSTQVEVVCKRLELLCTHLTISDSSSFADIAQAIEDSKVITPVTDSNTKTDDAYVNLLERVVNKLLK